MDKAILILGIFIALGVIFDKLSYITEKRKVHAQLKKLLEKIKAATFPDVHKIAIDSCLKIYSTTFRFKEKPIVSGLRLIFISWFLTSLAYIISIPFDLYRMSNRITKWHDYLPWYPTYFVNFIFDLCTIVITIQILKWIKDKNVVYSITGLLFDIFIAYTLFVFCIGGLKIGDEIAEKIIGGNDFVNHQVSSDAPFLFSQKNFAALGIPKSTFNKIENNGFSEGAVISIVVPPDFEDQPFGHVAPLFSVSAFYKYVILRKSYVERTPISIVATQADKCQTFSGYGEKALSPFVLAVSATTLIPTFLFIFTLLTFYVSKEVFYLTKLFLNRLVKTSLVEETAIDKFSPGAHLGTVLGLVVALLKLLDDLIK